MREYEDDEYEDYDDYEEQGYRQEEGGEEEDEYEEEEEEPKPTKEELEYLELRQKLKESIRKRMKKEASGSQEIKKDNFGSFFGPSKPVIAQRVIQESKSLLENQHLAARILKARQNVNKSSSTRSVGSKPGAHRQAPGLSELKKKAQKIKDTRDYSFLLSEDADLPASSRQPLARSLRASSSDARSVEFSSHSSRQSPASNVRNVNGDREERRPVPGNGRSNSRPGSANGHNNSRPGSANGHSNSRLGSVNSHVNPRTGFANKSPRPGSASAHSNPRPGSSNGNVNPRSGPVNGQSNLRPGPSKLSSNSKPPIAANRKQLSINSGNGPGRPAVSNGLPPKKPILPPQKSSLQSLKSSIPAGTNPSTAKMQSASKYQVEPRRDIREADRGKVQSKQSLALSRPNIQAQIDKPQRQMTSHGRQPDQRPKKRPSRPFPDDDDDDGAAAISMIRKMFGYNPQKFAGRDDDDSDMEANFDDIMREEKRSARIARQEDEEQLRLIEEEERREQMRRMGKRRKMG